MLEEKYINHFVLKYIKFDTRVIKIFLTRRLSKIFLFFCHTKNFTNLMNFHDQMTHLLFLHKEALETKSVNKIKTEFIYGNNNNNYLNKLN